MFRINQTDLAEAGGSRAQVHRSLSIADARESDDDSDSDIEAVPLLQGAITLPPPNGSLATEAIFPRPYRQTDNAPTIANPSSAYIAFMQEMENFLARPARDDVRHGAEIVALNDRIAALEEEVAGLRATPAAEPRQLTPFHALSLVPGLRAIATSAIREGMLAAPAIAIGNSLQTYLTPFLTASGSGQSGAPTADPLAPTEKPLTGIARSVDKRTKADYIRAVAAGAVYAAKASASLPATFPGTLAVIGLGGLGTFSAREDLAFNKFGVLTTITKETLEKICGDASLAITPMGKTRANQIMEMIGATLSVGLPIAAWNLGELGDRVPVEDPYVQGIANAALYAALFAAGKGIANALKVATSYAGLTHYVLVPSAASPATPEAVAPLASVDIQTPADDTADAQLTNAESTDAQAWARWAARHALDILRNAFGTPEPAAAAFVIFFYPTVAGVMLGVEICRFFQPSIQAFAEFSPLEANTSAEIPPPRPAAHADGSSGSNHVSDGDDRSHLGSNHSESSGQSIGEALQAATGTIARKLSAAVSKYSAGQTSGTSAEEGYETHDTRL